MAIGINTPGVHHVTLRTSDIDRSRKFYAELLGLPVLMDSPELVLFQAGNTAIAIRAPAPQTPKGDSFDPFRVGLDHVALGCADDAELERVAAALADAGVENTGVKTDETLGKRYVAFKDPDRISWEFYSV